MSTRQIGQYELLEKIGHGATGRVWRARLSMAVAKSPLVAT